MSSRLHPDTKCVINPHDDDSACSNPSSNTSITELIDRRILSRRRFLQSSVAIGGATLASGTALSLFSNPAEATPAPSGAIGFTSVPANIVPMTDGVTVPDGYTARVLVAWGDSLTGKPNWDPSQPMDEDTQLHCYGAHTDGMHFFPFPGTAGNVRGLLVANHEYVDPALVNGITPYAAYATTAITLDMVRAQQAAHGASVLEIFRKGSGWRVNRQSTFNRRITGNTPMRVRGPAAGNAMLKTTSDTTGRLVSGTLNNCAHGYTPWGTYLTCEENWNGYFGSNDPAFVPTAHEARYGVSRTGFGYRWHEADPRFDLTQNRNEPNRFGWIVEIDPWNRASVPVKRTALGRFKHESVIYVVGSDNRIAFYSGDDERNEYLYKFVPAGSYDRNDPIANRNLLDTGTLYVARLNDDGTGEWLPLVFGQNGLTPENGFADQGEVLVKTRQAADRLGATMMDRPEWIAAHPTTGELFMTLTNNSRRGNTPASSTKVDGTSAAASANPAVNAANPRPDNDFGHIIRWRENGSDVAATGFSWDIFVQCGDKATAKTLGSTYTPGEFGGQTVGYQGNIVGDDYGAPDGLWFDYFGRLWIQTDQVGNATGDWVNIGGNAMLCANPDTGETRRFMTSPRNCEVTGVTSTPDGRTFFVGIQHPGEDWVNTVLENSTWPDSGFNGPTRMSANGPVKPRSGVVVITKNDGGVIGT
ncbi:MAG: PhoX family protein [Gammaproteobacteria bacterium]